MQKTFEQFEEKEIQIEINKNRESGKIVYESPKQLKSTDFIFRKYLPLAASLTFFSPKWKETT